MHACNAPRHHPAPKPGMGTVSAPRQQKLQTGRRCPAPAMQHTRKQACAGGAPPPPAPPLTAAGCSWAASARAALLCRSSGSCCPRRRVAAAGLLGRAAFHSNPSWSPAATAWPRPATAVHLEETEPERRAYTRPLTTASGGPCRRRHPSARMGRSRAPGRSRAAFQGL